MFLLHKKRPAQDAIRCIGNMTVYGSLHLARKADLIVLFWKEIDINLKKTHK